MTPNMLRRLAQLELAVRALPRYRKAIVKNAASSLTPDQLELFISGIRAKRQGRPLNAAELAAEQAYVRAVKAELASVERSNPLQRALLRLAGESGWARR